MPRNGEQNENGQKNEKKSSGLFGLFGKKEKKDSKSAELEVAERKAQAETEARDKGAEAWQRQLQVEAQRNSVYYRADKAVVAPAAARGMVYDSGVESSGSENSPEKKGALSTKAPQITPGSQFEQMLLQALDEGESLRTQTRAAVQQQQAARQQQRLHASPQLLSDQTQRHLLTLQEAEAQYKQQRLQELERNKERDRLELQRLDERDAQRAAIRQQLSDGVAPRR